MKKPEISVILPCYNHSGYLEERLQSVLTQSLSVTEVIFLDDASTDNSLFLAESYLSECTVNVKIVANLINSRSPMSQWNRGVQIARGEYIWIAETDDYCDSSLLETLFDALVKCNAVLSFAASNYVDSKGDKCLNLEDAAEERLLGMLNESLCIEGRCFNSRYMMSNCAIPNASAVLFRRDVYISAGLGNASMKFCGDWDIWTRMAALGNVAYVASKLNSFRFHQNNTSVKRSAPEAQAEFLACSLSMLYEDQIHSSQSATSNSPINIMSFILLGKKQCVALRHALSSFRSKNFFDIVKSYNRLDRVPRLTTGAWLMLGVINYLRYITKSLPF